MSNIIPKFADDTVAIAVGEDCGEVQTKLQDAADGLLRWCEENGMALNCPKTKLINFSAGGKDIICVKLGEELISNSRSVRYLGIVLDENLDFQSHVERVIGRANSALNKVCVMIRGRRGLPVGIAVDLYRSLVRPHLEYAIPAWAMLTEKQVVSLERVQSRGLKRVMGVFDGTGSNAIEVVANIVPFRLRIVELCNKEWVKTMGLPDSHSLKGMAVEGYSYDGKSGTPLGYLNYVSRDIKTKLESGNFLIEQRASLESSVICDQIKPSERSIFEGKMGNSKNRTDDQARLACDQFSSFLESVGPDVVLAFTDGSVAGEGCFGRGGYGVVIYSKEKGVISETCGSVGEMTDNVACEVEGILSALHLVSGMSLEDSSVKKFYVLTDCRSALDVVVNQSDIRRNLKELRRLWRMAGEMKSRAVEFEIIWIPGHAGIKLNDEADRLAKMGSHMESVRGDNFVSQGVLNRLIKEKIASRWARMWGYSEAGGWTKELLGKVGRKLRFPRDRGTGMSYVRLLVNNTSVNENMFRFGLVDTRECECGGGIQTVEHVLMSCDMEREQREIFKNKAEKIWMDECRGGGDLPFNIRLLLAPFTLDKLNREAANKILSGTFEFLSKLSRVF